MAKDKQVPDANAVRISEAPPLGPSGVDTMVPVSVETVRAPIGPESLYWFGALPAIGKKKIIVPSGTEFNYALNDFLKEIETTALEAWQGRHTGGVRAWMGKCEWFQDIQSNNFSFPAYTDEVIREETQTDRIPWPGAIGRFSDLRVREILEGIQNTGYRPKGPDLETGLPSPKNYTTCHVIDYTFGHMSGCPGGASIVGWKGMACKNCQAIEATIPDSATKEARRIHGLTPTFKEPGDLPASDFVYFMKLAAPVSTPRQDYPRLVKSLPHFFLDPPPPLSADLAKKSDAA